MVYFVVEVLMHGLVSMGPMVLDYNVFRNDRNLLGGGVLIAVKDTYIATAVPELHTDCEIVWCKLELVGHKAV
jgi:hypothetical protein